MRKRGHSLKYFFIKEAQSYKYIFCIVRKDRTRYIYNKKKCLQKKFKAFPVLHDKKVKGFKEQDAVQMALEKMAESLDFSENGNFIRASSN